MHIRSARVQRLYTLQTKELCCCQMGRIPNNSNASSYTFGDYVAYRLYDLLKICLLVLLVARS